MIKYPLSFHAKADAKSGIQSVWNIESQNIPIRCAIPPEFEGPGGAVSPEDLFAQALTNCFVATFKVYAEKSKLEFSDLAVDTELVVDLNEAKKPIMKTCVLHVAISGCANPERTKLVAERAWASGFILNSVKTDLKLDLKIL